MKNSIIRTKQTFPILLGIIIIASSLAWTAEQPMSITYSTNVGEKTTGTTVKCEYPRQFERAKKMLLQTYPEIDIQPNQLKGIVFYHNLPDLKKIY